jgi:hypothetical protein
MIFDNSKVYKKKFKFYRLKAKKMDKMHFLYFFIYNNLQFMLIKF